MRVVRQCWLIALAAIGVVPITGAAQDSLIITGRVANDSGAPLAAAEVFARYLKQSTRTRFDGRYRLAIPVAKHTGERGELVARLIGYRLASDTFPIIAGAIVRDFTLKSQPLDFGCGPARPRAPSKDRRPFSAQEILDLLRAQYIDCGPGPDLRDRILDDSIVLNYFAALLLGRSPWPLGADTLHALSWLQQAGDARFLPVYLRFTVVNPKNTTMRQMFVFNDAIFGLIALDTLEEARNRILALGQDSTSALYRASVGYVLAQQNTETARGLLCQVATSDLPLRVKRTIDSAIAAPIDRPNSEFTVPAIPPCARPGWYEDDSSWSGADHQGFLKRAVMIVFEPQATRRQKQMAVDTIHGKVIGGSLVPPSWGYYDVQVADDGTGAQLTEAVGLLKTLPQVRFAALIYGNKPDFTPIRIRGMPCSGITIDRVPEIPPGGRPAWLYDDSMQIVGSGRVSKNVISIAFIAGASQEVKQAAIGSICGVVVGGMPQTGLYLVKIPADGTESAVHDAVKKIRAMPGILVAAIYTTSGLAP